MVTESVLITETFPCWDCIISNEQNEISVTPVGIKRNLRTIFNPVHATGVFLFLSPESLKNQSFSGFLRACRKRPVTWNGLKNIKYFAKTAIINWWV